MKNETKTLQLEVKFAGDAETTGAFTGLCAAYGNLDLVGDIIEPGAFTASLEEHKANGTKPALLWQHDLDSPIGVIDELIETPQGLKVKGRLALDTVKGKEARALLKIGGCTGLSIGFKITKSKRGADGARRILAAYLGEISFVTLPANPKAKVTDIKAAGDAAKGQKMTDLIDDGAAAGIPAEMVEKLAELEEKAAKIDDIETKLADAMKRADAFELKLARPGIITSRDSSADLAKKAFNGFLRHGREALPVEEVKSLVVADDTRGGYLAPAEFSKELDRNIVQFSPVRQAARIGTTSSGSVIIPRRTTELTAGWVGETEARSEATPAYGQVEIAINEIACYVDVSTMLLEDSALSLETELAFDLAEQFGKVEGTAFVSGDGVKKPEGFMSNADLDYTASGSATDVTADGLIDLMYDMAPAYRQRGVWMANGSTIATIRKFKDGQGQYLWQAGLQEGAPATILGRPVIEAPDMPDISGNAYPIVFGDFSVGYRIYDKVSLSILRDPYSVATSGLVRFHARRRVGGGVVRAEALRKLKVAVS